MGRSGSNLSWSWTVLRRVNLKSCRLHSPGDTELPQSGPNQPELTPDVDQFVFRSDSDVERTVVETLFNKQG